MKNLEEELKAFGIKVERWHEAAQKVRRRFRRVEDGAEVFMRKRHKDEKEATAERHRTVATATLTGGVSTRAGGDTRTRHLFFFFSLFLFSFFFSPWEVVSSVCTFLFFSQHTTHL